MTAIVNRLDEFYGDAVQCEIRDATTPESRAEIEAYGFGNHGMVIFDAQGNLRWKMDGHLMREPAISQAVERVLEEVD